MKTAIDLKSNTGLNTFANIVMGVLESNLSSITGAGMKFTIKASSSCGAADLKEAYPDGAVVMGDETKNSLEIGLIGHIPDLTAIADIMMMGDGESKQELDSDAKDAVGEIGNQFLGGLVVPVDTQLSQKLSFKVTATDSIASAAFKGDSYTVIDFAGELKGKPLELSVYMADGFLNLFGGGEQATLDTSSLFGDLGDDPMSSGGGNTNPIEFAHAHSANMDMLLDIDIPVSVRMGSAKLFLKDILGLGPGNIVELDQNADESIELVVNGKLVARGEVVIVDGYFGFRIKEIISKAERIRRLKD